MITFQILSDRSLFPNVPLRMQNQDSILAGTMEAPYQYRIMEPILGYSLQRVIRHFLSNPIKVHTLSYQILLFFCFLGIYSQFYFFLKKFFSDSAALIGIILLALVIPLGISSYWQDGDYYNLLFYVMGLNLIFNSKDKYLPLLIGIGVFNRSQIIFLVVFYGIYLYSEKLLFRKRSYVIIGLCFAAFFITFYAMRFYFGFKVSPYPLQHELSSNYSLRFKILQVWTEEVFVFITLSIIAYKKSSVFFRLSFLSLIIYTILFFFNSILGQLAKFFPAYLIMIPMCLEVLTGESTLKKKDTITS